MGSQKVRRIEASGHLTSHLIFPLLITDVTACIGQFPAIQSLSSSCLPPLFFFLKNPLVNKFVIIFLLLVYVKQQNVIFIITLSVRHLLSAHCDSFVSIYLFIFKRQQRGNTIVPQFFEIGRHFVSIHNCLFYLLVLCLLLWSHQHRTVVLFRVVRTDCLCYMGLSCHQPSFTRVKSYLQ